MIGWSFVLLTIILSYSVKQALKKQVENLLDMYFVGVALGLAYAHENSGDTVSSVMVGGLRTVRNGDFDTHTNDPLMWYIKGEEKLFDRTVSCQPIVLHTYHG